MLFSMYGKLVAQPGKREALVAKMLRAAELMKNVNGCLLYVVNTQADDPDAVWITEIWQDEIAHGASLSMPGVRDLIMETMPLVAQSPEGTRLRPIGGKGLSTLGARTST